jgi:tetratricopeptide (TPR) repeat protein
MLPRSVVTLLCLGAALSATAHAQKLGTISFPNSGATTAQAPFVRGVLLLHSFQYEEAADAFRESQSADRDFALAYAGEALTYTHPVWNEQDTAAARAVLARLGPSAAARREKAKTTREQMYMDAVEALYGPGSKPERDTLFAAAMDRIVAAHPDDDEAKVFLALALLGLNQGERDVPTYMRAGAIAEEVLRRNPEHPGAAHFVIHAFDDPVHAPLGLWAARAYSKIAPGAMHAQHMTTHIFLAMGMWDDVVSQNVIASGPHPDRWRAGHATSWLGYAYLQQGRFDEARRHLQHLRRNAGASMRPGEAFHLPWMRAAYLIDSERWTDSVASWSFEASDAPALRAVDAFAIGYAALRAGNRARAERAAAELERIPSAGSGGFALSNPALARIFAAEMRAALLAADGRTDDAIAAAREATRMEDSLPVEFGPPAVVKPTHELAGEILLAAGRFSEAQREFTRALELAPGRSRSLLGLAHAASRAGDHAVAARAARDLLRNWHSADKGLVARADVGRLLLSAGNDGRSQR